MDVNYSPEPDEDEGEWCIERCLETIELIEEEMRRAGCIVSEWERVH